MNGSQVLLELVIVLGVAAVITLLFQALRLPVVLGYIVAGIVIGPHVPVPLVANAELVHVLSDSGEHSAEPGNLMRPETAPGNSALSSDQCERLRTTGVANDLLKPRANAR